MHSNGPLHQVVCSQKQQMTFYHHHFISCDNEAEISNCIVNELNTYNASKIDPENQFSFKLTTSITQKKRDVYKSQEICTEC